jgi:hypothetical protein
VMFKIMVIFTKIQTCNGGYDIMVTSNACMYKMPGLNLAGLLAILLLSMVFISSYWYVGKVT